MHPTKNFNRFSDAQRHALDARRNHVSRANAGGGKTSVLTERPVQALARGAAALRPAAILALTFTRKAAGEMRERLQAHLEGMARAAADPAEQAYWAGLAAEMPRAPIGTIDRLCSQVLREFALCDDGPDRIEPDFDVLDEYDQLVLRREAIDRVLNRLAGVPAGRAAADADVAAACRWWVTTQGYDALTGHLMTLLGHVVEPGTIVAAHRGLPPAADRVRAAWESLPAVRRLATGRAALTATMGRLVTTIDAVRKPSQTLTELRACTLQIADALADETQPRDQAALTLLAHVLLDRKGKPRGARNYGAVRADFEALQGTWCPLLQAFDFDFDGEVAALDAADRLVRLLGPVRAEYDRLCREANRYDFLTIVRRTRDLLRRRPEVGAALRARYRYVLVDEFQDTNYLRWEVIAHLAGTGPDGGLDTDRLFIVGDPQQSIFRFLHADVGVFAHVTALVRDANRRHGTAGLPTDYDDFGAGTPSTEEQRSGLMPLAENYRTLPRTLGVMERVFRHVFDPAAHGIDPAHNHFEVAYQPLVAGRQPPAPGVVGEVCYVIPEDADADETDDEGPTRPQVEAVVAELAALHGTPCYRGEDGGPGPLRWSDMAILLPSRTAVLTELERALRRRGVPFAVTGGIGFWQRQEVRDLVDLAACLADRGDELALCGVLRGPLGQLTDTELFFLSQLGRGRLVRGLSFLRRVDDELAVPAGAPDADRRWVAEREGTLPAEVRAALAELWRDTSAERRTRLRRAAERLGGAGTWRLRVDRIGHAELLAAALEESGADGLYAAENEGAVALANVARLLELVRREEASAAPGLARLARRLRDQVNESYRKEQAPADDGADAVQVLTVHGAKGLEFPVVAVLGMERRADRLDSRQQLFVKSPHDRLLKSDGEQMAEPAAGTVAVCLRHPRRPRETYQPRLFAALRNLDQAQQLAESRRLFYVAGTRAQERLILAGKPPRRLQDGGVGARPPSWQTWFEDALGITEEHKRRGVWEDATADLRVTIVTQPAAAGPAPAPPPAPCGGPIDLAALTERPRCRTLAATALADLRDQWARSRREWWLRYRAHVLLHLDVPPADVARAVTPEQVGTAIGTLVHRLFEAGGVALALPAGRRRPLLRAMAAGLFGSADAAAADRVVAGVEAIVGRLRRTPHAGAAFRRLVTAAGETEVDFALRLGRWQIIGRFDKLLATGDGYEVVDWKTDGDGTPDEIVRRHRPQMQLYALALYRAGRAVVTGGAVRVHLALTHGLRVEVLTFPVGALEALAAELEAELDAMDAYEPAEEADHVTQ